MFQICLKVSFLLQPFVFRRNAEVYMCNFIFTRSDTTVRHQSLWQCLFGHLVDSLAVPWILVCMSHVATVFIFEDQFGYKLLGSLFMSLSILNIFLPCLHIVKHCFWKDLRQSDFLPSLVNDSISWCGCSEKPFLFIFKPVWPHWIDFASKKKHF